MTEQSTSIVKLCAALVAAQAEMRNPPKDSVNPHFKSRFADLATVLDTVKPVLAKHKLAVMQLPCEVADIGPGLSTMLVHESGEWIRSTIGLRPAKQDPQGVGAALTYARRYGLQAVLGITADDDDDGNHASRAPQQRQAAAPPAQHRQQATQRPSADELKLLMRSRGWTDWKMCIHTINGAEGSDYTESDLPDAILADHLARFCQYLRSLPEKAKANV